MAITNYTAKEVQFKIVLHGPAFAGKSTLLNSVKSRIDAASCTGPGALQSGADVTLRHDFVPKNASLLDDFQIRFEIYTVPGNVVFNAPRKLALRDADGILFVADSQWEKIGDNIQSFTNLEENFKKLGTDLAQTPVVLLYNKRDLPDAAPVNYLDFVLNNRQMRMPAYETTTATGANVLAALREVSQMVVHRFAENSANQPAG